MTDTKNWTPMMRAIASKLWFGGAYWYKVRNILHRCRTGGDVMRVARARAMR